jgi:chitinase
MKLTRRGLAALLTAGLVGTGALTTAVADAAPAAVNPVTASPYIYLGAGWQPNVASTMSATGLKAFTIAFVLSNGGCTPVFDGGASAASNTINAVRNAGGDVIVSFGGWGGNKLGEHCSSVSALAGAYQKVITQYSLKAIDIDIEATEMSTYSVQDRVLGALKTVKANNPGLKVVVTMGTTTAGPDADGQRLIKQGKTLGANVDVWSIMPFDFSSGGDMWAHTRSAAEGLKGQLKSAFGWTDAQAYSHMGISSMNGKTDNAGETVTVANFTSILSYAQTNHLARLTYWSANRDRACGSGGDGDTCSGVSQNANDFSKVIGRFTG